MSKDNGNKRTNIFDSFHERFIGSTKSVSFLSVEDAYFRRPKTWVLNIFYLLVLVAVVVYMNINLSIGDYFHNIIRWNDIGDYFGRLFTIKWDYFFGYGFYQFSEGVVYQLYQTFTIAFLATLIGSILAIPFGLWASHRLFGKKAAISELFLIIIRTIPELLIALFMVSFSGVNVFTGIMALGLHSIGMIGKMYADQVDDISREPLEALDACGASSFQRIHLGVMPQVTPNFISVSLYRFDINVRSATIIGAVVGSDCGIGFSIMTHTGHPELLGAEILGVILLVLLGGAVSSFARRKLL